MMLKKLQDIIKILDENTLEKNWPGLSLYGFRGG